jgi:hypothetical protein
MTYKEFYDHCNRFLDHVDRTFTSEKHAARMRNAVLEVLVIAQDCERRGWA